MLLSSCGARDGDAESSDREVLTGLSDNAAGSSEELGRLISIESCAELTPLVEPALTGAHVLDEDDVPESNYPGTGSPYSFSCSWMVPGEDDVIWVRGVAGWDGTSREDVLDVYSDERKLTTPKTDFGADNFMVLEDAHNWELGGEFTLHVLAPKPPYSAKTGWVTLRYLYGSGASTSKPYNGFTLGLIEKARDVLSDEIASDVLLAMLEPDVEPTNS